MWDPGRMLQCGICDAQPQDARLWLLAELEALQEDPLVARLQHTSLLQILLRDVTGGV